MIPQFIYLETSVFLKTFVEAVILLLKFVFVPKAFILLLKFVFVPIPQRYLGLCWHLTGDPSPAPIAYFTPFFQKFNMAPLGAPHTYGKT